MSFFGFGAGVDVKVALKNPSRRFVAVKNEMKEVEQVDLFTANEDIAGTVVIRPKKAMQMLGIKVELIGEISLEFSRSDPYTFLSLVRELEPPGELTEEKKYDFTFANVDKPYETYRGNNVVLRYFVRVKVTRQYAANISRSLDFAVQNVTSPPELNHPIKMEVGIEDCLHIEFEYSQGKYHLQDVIIGKIYFLLVRIRIKHMELVIIKRESTGSGPNTYNESSNLAKVELMDGAPVRGESVPIRIFLSPYDLTPTMKNVHNKFSVRYYLNLVLVDEEDRRYFKQQEITLWRSTLKTIKRAGVSAGAGASAAKKADAPTPKEQPSGAGVDE